MMLVVKQVGVKLWGILVIVVWDVQLVHRMTRVIADGRKDNAKTQENTNINSCGKLFKIARGKNFPGFFMAKRNPCGTSNRRGMFGVCYSVWITISPLGPFQRRPEFRQQRLRTPLF